MKKSILIIGAGKLGTSLFRAMHENGYNNIVLAGRQHFSSLSSDHLNKNQYYSEFNNSLIYEHKFIFLCVKDDQIEGVVRQLLELDLDEHHIFHTSGFHTSEVLSTLDKAGVITGSFHPVQSFPEPFSDPVIWQDILCTYEGNEKGMPFLTAVCEKLKAHLVPVSIVQKKALHLSATLLTNYGVGLIGWAESVINRTFDPDLVKKFLTPMLEGVASNYRKTDVYSMLTGPLQRGDLQVIKGHLELLTGTEKQLYIQFAEFLLNHSEFKIVNREKIRDFIHASKI